MKKLEGKTIVVIGATGDIGSVLCKCFFEAGANIVLGARSKENLIQIQNSFDLGKTDVRERSMNLSTDANKPVEVDNLLKAAFGKFGRVDAVILSVGTWQRLGIDDKYEDAAKSFDFLYNSIFKPTAVAAFVAQKFLREHGGGLIVNISSHVAVRPYLKGNLSYGPMKAASRHLMFSLIAELANTLVRITDIQPALVDTPKNRAALPQVKEDEWKGAVKPGSIADWITENIDNNDILPEKLFESKVKVD